MAELPTSSKTKQTLNGILRHVGSYGSYQKAFAAKTCSTPPCPDAGSQSSRVDTATGPDVPDEAPEDPFEKLRAGLCKMGGTVLDFLFDLFAGERDKDLNELLKKTLVLRGALAMDGVGR